MKSLEERIKFRKEQRDAQAQGTQIRNESQPAAQAQPAAGGAQSGQASQPTGAGKHAAPKTAAEYGLLSVDELKGMLIDRGYSLDGSETQDDLIHTLTEDDKETAAAATGSAPAKS